MPDEQLETQEVQPDPNVVELDISEPEKDDDEPEPGKSRQEKRNERGHLFYEQMKEERDEIKQQMAEMRRQHDEEMAQVRREMASRQSPQTDPEQEAIDKKCDERDAAYGMVTQNGLSAEDREKLLQQARRLDQEVVRLMARSELKRNQPAPLNPIAQAIQIQYADVFADKTSMKRAAGLLAMWETEGQMNSPELVEKALAEARKWKQNRTRQVDPHPADRARLTGRSVASPTQRDNVVRISKSDRDRFQREADSVYSYLDNSPESRKKFNFNGDAQEERLKRYMRMLNKKS